MNNNNNNTTTNNRLLVYVRVKPVVDERSIIDVVDDRTLVFDPTTSEDGRDDVYFYHGKKFTSIGVRPNKNSSYTFDGVFNRAAENLDIFEQVTRPMVDATLNGYNSTVFAYGATGSGKTYTMLGKRGNPGVIYYTTRDLYDKLSVINDKDPLPAELRICYFEIYNEKIRDLLVFEQNNYIRCGPKRLRTTPERRRRVQNDPRNLPVRDASGGSRSLIIPDLTYHTPENAEQLIELLEAGNAHRMQYPTDANADSSRSHAIFQIVVTRRTRKLNGGGSQYELQNSKMSLIDLAGSERASVAYRAGNDRSKNLQREGGNINKSLLALGNCINALADKRGGHKHIPFRNSKLTRLLEDSLGGKCRTAMIATVCQQQSHYDDTQNTLVYASRAKCIKLLDGRNTKEVSLLPRNYKDVIDKQTKQIASLQSENEHLKSRIEELERQPPPQNNNNATFLASNNATFLASERRDGRSDANFLDVSSHTQELIRLYEVKGNIKMKILKYESKYKTNELKLTFKQIDDNRQQIVSRPYMTINEITRTQPINMDNNNISDSQGIKAQLRHYDQKRTDLLEEAEANQEDIDNILYQMSHEYLHGGYGTAEQFEETIKNFSEEHDNRQELEEKKFCEQHAYDLAQQVFNRLSTTEDLLNEAASVIKYAHTVYTGKGDDGPSVNKFSNLLKKLGGKKNVIWKDDKYELENNKDNQLLSRLASIHENFSLTLHTPYRNNNTLKSRRLSKNLVSLSNYTPEQSVNTTFDASR